MPAAQSECRAQRGSTPPHLLKHHSCMGWSQSGTVWLLQDIRDLAPLRCLVVAVHLLPVHLQQRAGTSDFGTSCWQRCQCISVPPLQQRMEEKTGCLTRAGQLITHHIPEGGHIFGSLVLVLEVVPACSSDCAQCWQPGQAHRKAIAVHMIRPCQCSSALRIGRHQRSSQCRPDSTGIPRC